MVEIPDVCEFEIKSSQVGLQTSCNGDAITIGQGGTYALHLTPEQAATLSLLINQSDIELRVEIKKKPS